MITATVATMTEAFVQHLAAVGASARAGDASSVALPALLGDEPHVRYLADLLGTATTTGRGRVASLDARRLRAVA